jgi:hypothetical protein
MQRSYNTSGQRPFCLSYPSRLKGVSVPFAEQRAGLDDAALSFSFDLCAPLRCARAFGREEFVRSVAFPPVNWRATTSRPLQGLGALNSLV